MAYQCDACKTVLERRQEHPGMKLVGNSRMGVAGQVVAVEDWTCDWCGTRWRRFGGEWVLA